MTRIILLLSILAVGCSTRNYSRDDLVKLAVIHQEIPVENKDAARNFMEAQRKYLLLLNEPFHGSTMPDHCRSEKIIGTVNETKNEVSYVSLVRIDMYGKPTACMGYGTNSLVWDYYVYCEGKNSILNTKLAKEHMPEFRIDSICN